MVLVGSLEQRQPVRVRMIELILDTEMHFSDGAWEFWTTLVMYNHRHNHC